MTDHFSRQQAYTSNTRLFIVLALISAFGIVAGIYSMTDRKYDHEQMSVTRTVAWEPRGTIDGSR